MKNSFVKYSIMAAALACGFTQTSPAGALREYFYRDVPGATLVYLTDYRTNLTGAIVFPELAETNRFPLANTGPFEGEYPDNNAALNNFGRWLLGYIEPPETGNYTFWIYGDDETRLWITTDAADPLNPAKKQPLSWVSGYTAVREWAKFPEQQSAPVALEKGKQYYVEVMQKEGGGNDGMGFGWQLPSGKLERPMQMFYFQPLLDPNDVVPVTGPNAAPISPISPGDLTIYDGMEVMLFADINLAPPYTVQWRRGTTDIPGATQSYLRFRARTTDNGAQFSIRVNGTLYGPYTLVVNGDNTPPTVASATLAAANPTQIQLVFSEEVTAATATNTANYALNNAGSIQNAQLQSDGRTVLLKTSLLMPTNVHTLTINNLQDMALPVNTIAANTQTNFLITDGAISFRVYNTTFATDLATLRTATTNSPTANATYTNNLFSEERVITTNSYPWNLAPLRDNYVGQIIGYLTAPETGNYRFGIASDDHSILYLGFTDQRSSKREICNYNGSTGRWNLGAQANQLSGNIALVAGQRYFFEAVYRDGTGNDGATVAWYTPSMVANGDVFPPATANNEAATTPYVIPATYVSTFNAFGNVVLKTNLPAAFSAAESTRPTLRVVADGSTPYAYQWYRGGAPIAGATASTYTLPYVRPADNNATFQVIVTNNFSSVTSVLAALTVTTDSTKPTVASAGSLFKQTIEVRLSEPVTPVTASNPANYLLSSSAGTPVAISSAVPDINDMAHVTLRTAALPETDLMKLVVLNLADLSAAANVMNPATNSIRANNFDALERINNTQAYSATAVGDQILMTAGGSDIWGTADQCAFLYRTVTGNFDYKIQGLSLQTVNQWCKMGLMVRASTNANERNAFNAFTPLTPSQNTYSPQIRDAAGANSFSSDVAGTILNLGLQGGVAARPTVAYPSWVRLQRIGNTLYWYYGTTGTNWTFWTYYDSAATAEALPNQLLLGLALTSHDTARTVDGVMASFSAVNDVPLYLTREPTNTLVIEGSSTNFYAAVGGTTPYLYEWRKDNNPIPDATNATLVLTRVPFSDNGALISCRVSNPYGQTVTTSNALLTVTKDGLAPTVRYYLLPKININATEVKLLFSEPMDPTSAQLLSNYQITTSPGGAPLNISGAALGVDERTVTLTTVAQTPGTTYKVVVNNVRDLACCPPNPVAPNSTDYFFYAGSQPQFAQRADGYIIMETENAQEVVTASDGDVFELRNTAAGYSGTGYMLVPNGRGTGGTTGTGTALFGTGGALVFHVNMNRTGRHIIWVRGWNENTATAGNDDSIFLGFNNTVGIGDPATDLMVGMNTDVNQSQLTGYPAAGWSWRSDRSAGTDPLTFTNTTTGLHRFIIWAREDGTLVDKVVLEASDRTSTSTAAPAPCTANGGLGEPETWEFIVAPPSPPTISLSSPTNGQTFPGNATIPITTTITGPTPIVLVEFFQGTNLLGTATTSPFEIDWDSVPEGIYSLTARVTDGLGYQATSTAVQVIVDSSKPVAYAVGSLQGTGIGVYFGDVSGLDPATATNVANYTVNSGATTVTDAALEPDNLAVMLSLSAPISGPFSVEVKNVADRGFGPNVMNTVTLQSTVVTWPLNQDVGTLSTNPPPLFTDPIMPGLAQAIGTNGFYVRAGGHDIWDTADGMHFVHQPVTGDFDVAVRVASLLRPNEWSKAGLMVRQDLTGSSRNYLIAATPTNGQNLITMQWRLGAGLASASIADASRPRPSPIPNAWLRLTRTNQTFAFYWGTNGTQWVSVFTTNEVATPYPAQVHVGLATTSHDNGTNVANLTSAYYYNLSGLKATVLPTLRIGVSGTEVAVSWTSDDPTLLLQASDSIQPVNWQPAGGSLVVNGNTSTVTVPRTAQQRYFRLVRP